jgi:hypothetical protein
LAEPRDERVAVFDAEGRAAGALPRDEAKSSCLAVGAVRRLLGESDLTREVVFFRSALQLNVRDVRLVPGGGIWNVVYHVASYLGRTDVPLDRFRAPADEIVGLRYAAAPEVDRMLARGELAPNMAFLWLTHARALLALAGGGA